MAKKKKYDGVLKPVFFGQEMHEYVPGDEGYGEEPGLHLFHSEKKKRRRRKND